MQGSLKGIIFRRTLRDSRSGILGWGLVFAAMSVMIVSMFPLIDDMLEVMAPLLESPFVQSLVGDVDQFASLEGFLGVKLFAMLPLFLAIYLVLFALGIVSTEEERGTLDILLSTPVSRWQVVLEKLGALLVALVAILGLMFIGLVIGNLTLPEGMGLDLGRAFMAVLNLLPVSVFIVGLTLALSTLLRSRGTAAGISAAIVAGSYFVSTLGDMASGPLGTIKYLSFFHYYGGANIFTRGIPWGGFIALLVVGVALMAVGGAAFQRRDLTG